MMRISGHKNEKIYMFIMCHFTLNYGNYFLNQKGAVILLGVGGGGAFP